MEEATFSVDSVKDTDAVLEWLSRDTEHYKSESKEDKRKHEKWQRRQKKRAMNLNQGPNNQPTGR